MSLTKVTSNVIASGVIPAEYDDANVRSDILKLALHQAVDGNRVAYNLENSFVDGFEDDTGITTETNCDRDTTGEYISTVSTASSFTTIWGAVTSGGAYGNGWNDYLFRNVISSVSAGTYNPVKFTVTTSGAGDIDNASIGIRTGSYTDTTTTPTEILWGGSSGASGASQTSDELSFSMTGGTEYIFTADMGSNNNTYYFTGSLPSGSGSAYSVGSGNFGYTVADADNNAISTARVYFIEKIEGKLQTFNATGTLISDTQTASSSRTSCSGVIIYSDASGTATLGTDLKIYFTCNNGTNWTEASSYGTATTYSGTKKLVKLGATTCTAGTQVAMKAVWANQQSSSGTEKTITAVGDAQHATDQYKIGSSSAKFDGTGDALRIAGNLPAITGTGSFTAECWFRLNGSGTGHQRILNYGDSAGGSELINVDFYRPSSTLRCYASTSGSSRNIFSQTTTSHGISDNTWHHLAYVRNGTSFKVYIDGSEKVSGTSSSSIGTGTGFAFGGYYNDGGSSTEYFYGHIDEMRISSVARYTGAFTPSTSAFTADTDTVLLIHSDTSNGSTTFADSSVVAGKETRLEGWAVNY